MEPRNYSVDCPLGPKHRDRRSMGKNGGNGKGNLLMNSFGQLAAMVKVVVG